MTHNVDTDALSVSRVWGMKPLIIIVAVTIAAIWWRYIRLAEDLGCHNYSHDGMDEPWRDCRTDRLEDVWVTLYEARR